MIEIAKRTECVKVCFEPRLYGDLGIEADKQDRKLADLCYIVMRRFAYGNLNGSQPPSKVTARDHEGL